MLSIIFRTPSSTVPALASREVGQMGPSPSSISLARPSAPKTQLLNVLGSGGATKQTLHVSTRVNLSDFPLQASNSLRLCTNLNVCLKRLSLTTYVCILRYMHIKSDLNILSTHVHSYKHWTTNKIGGATYSFQWRFVLDTPSSEKHSRSASAPACSPFHPFHHSEVHKHHGLKLCVYNIDALHDCPL